MIPDGPGGQTITSSSGGEADKLYRRFLEHLGEGVLAGDVETQRITFCNVAAARLLGYSEAELLDLSVGDLHPAEARPRIEAILGQTLHGTEFPPLEIPMRRKDGSCLTVELTPRILESEGRRWLLAVLRDLTESRRAEATLRESRAQLAAVLASMEDLVFGLELDGRIGGYFSPQMKSLYLPPQDFLGKSIPDVLPPDAGIAFASCIEAVRETGVPRSVDYELPLGDLRSFWNATISPRLSLSNEISGFTVVCRDITERKRIEVALREREEQMRLLVQHAPASLAMFDRQMRYLVASRRWMADYGLGETELRGRCHYDVFPEIGEAWKEVHRRALAGEALSADEDRFDRADGSVQWLRWDVRPWHGPSGEVGGIVIFSEDITARKNAEGALLRSQKLEALGTLAGGIAHDFNNVLFAISGNVVLAASEVGAEHPAAGFIDQIGRSATRAKDLVRQILSFSRPEEARHQPVDLLPVVREALQLLRPALPTLIEIRADLAPGLPPVDADPSQIQQVLVNLATNAAHAIGSRGGVVGIRLERSPTPSAPGLSFADGAGWVQLSVTDDGSGMDEATLLRIFDPFFTTKAAGEGTGLGLSVVHGIVKAMGGVVDVKSQPGKGSAFTVRLPATMARVAQKKPAAVAVSAPWAARILYVDDEEALCELVPAILGRVGYEVTALNDPREALRRFRESPAAFDTVVTDVSMPGMSGFELARELLLVRPGLPVVVTSGYLRPEDEEMARGVGIRDFILKPDTVDELGATLDRLLRASGPPRRQP